MIATGALVKKIGVGISAGKLEELGIEPALKTKNAVYWRENDFPCICLALAKDLEIKAKEFDAVNA